MSGSVDPVQFKGSPQGVLVTVREDVDFALALKALDQKIAQQPEFFAGGQVSLDLGWREASPREFELLEALCQARRIRLLGIVSTSLATRSRAEERGHKTIIGRLGLAQHQGRAIRREALASEPRGSGPPERGRSSREEELAEPPGPSAQPEEPTLMLRRTLRSGQAVRFEGNVVIMGDVNPGAQIEAEGDVIVLGSLRGQAHAGCAGREEAVVVAMVMEPTQLRIGARIWHGSEEGRKKRAGLPMKAVVASGGIRLDPYGA